MDEFGDAIFVHHSKKIKVFVNGDLSDGKDLEVNDGWTTQQILAVASQRAQMAPPATRMFNSDGAEVDDPAMIENGDIIFISQGQNFINPRRKGMKHGRSKSKMRRSSEGTGPIAAGMLFGGFRVGKLLGEGGFGSVRLGTHAVTSDTVAMKFLLKGKQMTANDAERVTTEISCLAELNHPNIIRLIRVINEPDVVVIVLDYAPGGDLKQFVESQADGRLHEPLAREKFTQIVKGVQYAHNHKIVHRDLKLENVLLGPEQQCLITDFGLSQYTRPGEVSNNNSGSLYYMAPEVLKGTPSAAQAVDVWCLGIMLYAMLVGKVPFRSRTLDVAEQQLREEHQADYARRRRNSVVETDARRLSAVEPTRASVRGDSRGLGFEQGEQRTASAATHATSPRKESRSLSTCTPLTAATPSNPIIHHVRARAASSVGLPPAMADSAHLRQSSLTDDAELAAITGVSTPEPDAELLSRPDENGAINTSVAVVVSEGIGQGSGRSSVIAGLLPAAAAAISRPSVVRPAALDVVATTGSKPVTEKDIVDIQRCTSMPDGDVDAIPASASAPDAGPSLPVDPELADALVPPAESVASKETEPEYAAITPRDYAREAEARCDVVKVIAEVKNNILSGKYVIPGYVSIEAADLMRRMLHPDPNLRAKMQDIISHPWMTANIRDLPRQFSSRRIYPSKNSLGHVEEADVDTARSNASWKSTDAGQGNLVQPPLMAAPVADDQTPASSRKSSGLSVSPSRLRRPFARNGVVQRKRASDIAGTALTAALTAAEGDPPADGAQDGMRASMPNLLPRRPNNPGPPANGLATPPVRPGLVINVLQPPQVAATPTDGGTPVYSIAQGRIMFQSTTGAIARTRAASNARRASSTRIDGGLPMSPHIGMMSPSTSARTAEVMPLSSASGTAGPGQPIDVATGTQVSPTEAGVLAAGTVNNVISPARNVQTIAPFSLTVRPRRIVNISTLPLTSLPLAALAASTALAAPSSDSASDGGAFVAIAPVPIATTTSTAVRLSLTAQSGVPAVNFDAAPSLAADDRPDRVLVPEEAASQGLRSEQAAGPTPDRGDGAQLERPDQAHGLPTLLLPTDTGIQAEAASGGTTRRPSLVLSPTAIAPTDAASPFSQLVSPVERSASDIFGTSRTMDTNPADTDHAKMLSVNTAESTDAAAAVGGVQLAGGGMPLPVAPLLQGNGALTSTSAAGNDTPINPPAVAVTGGATYGRRSRMAVQVAPSLQGLATNVPIAGRHNLAISGRTSSKESDHLVDSLSLAIEAGRIASPSSMNHALATSREKLQQVGLNDLLVSRPLAGSNSQSSLQPTAVDNQVMLNTKLRSPGPIPRRSFLEAGRSITRMTGEEVPIEMSPGSVATASTDHISLRSSSIRTKDLLSAMTLPGSPGFGTGETTQSPAVAMAAKRGSSLRGVGFPRA